MDEKPPDADDNRLRAAILTGLEAVTELEIRFRKPLERYLVGMCDRNDGRSQEKAVEVAGQILAECFTRSPSLLERWKGGENLDAFLRKAAANRLKSWWASAEKKRTEVNSESISIANAEALRTFGDDEEAGVAGEALRAGIEAAHRQCPEGLVFLRLKGLHGVDQRAISRCWGHHEAQTSRRIKDAMELIRRFATEHAAGEGCELTLELWQQALHRNPGILLGNHSSSTNGHENAELKKLAMSGGDSETKHRAVMLMCREPEMLAFFARALNRQCGTDPLVIKDSALAGVAARLSECVRRSLAILDPSEAAGHVTSLMSDSFSDVLADVGADGGTLWMLRPGAAVLEAVFNPLEPDMAGRSQPLASGIVSFVIATGEPACVTGVSDDLRHSPAIDMIMGKPTRSMIAVPFAIDGAKCGVLTAVRLGHGKEFGAPEVGIMVRFSEVLGMLMYQKMVGNILDSTG